MTVTCDAVLLYRLSLVHPQITIPQYLYQYPLTLLERPFDTMIAKWLPYNKMATFSEAPPLGDSSLSPLHSANHQNRLPLLFLFITKGRGSTTNHTWLKYTE